MTNILDLDDGNPNSPGSKVDIFTPTGLVSHYFLESELDDGFENEGAPLCGAPETPTPGAATPTPTPTPSPTPTSTATACPTGVAAAAQRSQSLLVANNILEQVARDRSLGLPTQTQQDVLRHPPQLRPPVPPASPRAPTRHRFWSQTISSSR